MPSQNFLRWGWLQAVGFLFVFWASACSVVNTTQTPVPSVTLVLTPYRTPAPSQTLAALKGSAKKTATTTIPPPPTPTPFTYSIKEGDTMLGIAFQHGISLEALQAANPEVDPQFLSVGTALVIPIGEGTPSAIPTPTPYPVQMGEPVCYPSAENALWCFVPLNHDQPQPLENVSAWVRLYSPEGDLLDGKEAIPPLNLVPPGKILPLMVYFPAGAESAWPQGVFAEAELLTAFGAAAVDDRYLPVQISTESGAPQAGGRQVHVQGRVSLAPEAPGSAAQLRLAAVGYGPAGEIAGVRIWESQSSLAPDASLPFDLTVYSLGPPIERIEVFGEATGLIK